MLPCWTARTRAVTPWKGARRESILGVMLHIDAVEGFVLAASKPPGRLPPPEAVPRPLRAVWPRAHPPRRLQSACIEVAPRDPRQAGARRQLRAPPRRRHHPRHGHPAATRKADISPQDCMK